MIELKEYIDFRGKSPFGKWFDSLDPIAAAKVTTYLIRLSYGNFSQVASVGSGVYEIKISWGPGYRVYFGKEGEKLIILLGGGTKKRQSKDIQKAHSMWEAYKKRKKSN